MEERTASDIMEKNFVTASPSTSVFSLVHMFVKNKVAAIPIVDEEEQLIGIITDADLLYKKSSLTFLTTSTYWEPAFITMASASTTRALKS